MVCDAWGFHYFREARKIGLKELFKSGTEEIDINSHLEKNASA